MLETVEIIATKYKHLNAGKLFSLTSWIKTYGYRLLHRPLPVTKLAAATPHKSKAGPTTSIHQMGKNQVEKTNYELQIHGLAHLEQIADVGKWLKKGNYYIINIFLKTQFSE